MLAKEISILIWDLGFGYISAWTDSRCNINVVLSKRCSNATQEGGDIFSNTIPDDTTS